MNAFDFSALLVVIFGGVIRKMPSLFLIRKTRLVVKVLQACGVPFCIAAQRPLLILAGVSHDITPRNGLRSDSHGSRN